MNPQKLRMRKKLIAIIVFLYPVLSLFAQKKSLTAQDIMKFKAIHHAQISENGYWVAYTAKPDRGDGEVIVRSVSSKKEHIIPRGNKPQFSKNGKWTAAELLPETIELEKAKKDKKPKKGMALLNTATGELLAFEKVESFAFSNDSKWLAWSHFKKDKEKKKESKEDGNQDEESSNNNNKVKEKPGTSCVLYQLDSGRKVELAFVKSFAFDSTSHYFAYSVVDTSGMENNISILNLKSENISESLVDFQPNTIFTNLTWNNEKGYLTYLSTMPSKATSLDSSALWIWNPQDTSFHGLIRESDLPEDWYLPKKNELVWTKDGERLFFGIKPESERWQDNDGEENEQGEKTDLYNLEGILEKCEVDVWHWNDPLIIPHQKKQWKERKDRTYHAVFHLESNTTVPLADKNMPTVQITQNPQVVLGNSNEPYAKLQTWDGPYRDYYIVDLQTGDRSLIAEKLSDRISLSPRGNYIVYYHQKHWFLYNVRKKSIQNLTRDLTVPFYDEDHDRPSEKPSYRLAGWTAWDKDVLIYDKFDIWQFNTKTGKALCLTAGEGRKEKRVFRIQKLDTEQQWFKHGETVLLSAYHDFKKHTAFYSAQIGIPGVKRLLEMKKTFTFLKKAKESDEILYTREDYNEFPDLWIGDSQFKSQKKISNVCPQIKDFAWGSAEQVEWLSDDGIPLQGVLIKPGNCQKGKRYPVLVYFYRLYSYRLYRFNAMELNHRPNFPFYASNGYALFLPDIRFEIGRPGFSATKCIVPGVQKLVDMGIADPERIALQGHSWGGYQTAFIVTQTHMFCCAVSGAPVSNMTSAYGGVRYESGMSRQFQYEKTQSRLGKNLWEARDVYIDNSPLFFADRIQTPLLIMFGDEDGAVPWTQGIELYMAMRRLEKPCVFLQYRDEPHHPKKYANKVDYTLKMKAFFDHYCKDTPAPVWMTEGVPYLGK